MPLFGGWGNSQQQQLDQLTEDMKLVLAYQRSIYSRGKIMSIQLDALTAQVAATATVQASAVVLIQGIAQKLQEALDNAADPAAIQALADSLKAGTDALAEAVTANTPSA